jgi:HEAT repeat protein
MWMKEITTMKNLMIATMMMTAAYAASTETALQTLESALGSKNPETRKEAVTALSVAGPKYQSRLEAMLKDKDVQVRAETVVGLGKLKDAAGLRMALDDNAAEVRFAAAKALYEMKDPEGERALIRVLNGESKASSSFMTSQKRDAMHTLQTPKSVTMMAFREAAGFIPVPGVGEAVSMSTKMVQHKNDQSGRSATALLLGKSANPEVVAALERALGDKNAGVRAAAIQALAMTDDARLAAHAERMMGDKSRSVRLRAAAAYLKLSSIEASETESVE